PVRIVDAGRRLGEHSPAKCEDADEEPALRPACIRLTHQRVPFYRRLTRFPLEKCCIYDSYRKFFPSAIYLQLIFDARLGGESVWEKEICAPRGRVYRHMAGHGYVIRPVCPFSLWPG